MPLYTPSPVTYSSKGVLIPTAPLSGDVRPYVGIWDRFRNQKVWLLGSSSTASATTGGVNPETSTTGFSEYTEGYWWSAQARGMGARLLLNSGVSGYTTAQVLAKYNTVIAAGTADARTITVLQLQANDLPAGNIDYTSAKTILYNELALGKRIVLVVPHATAAAVSLQKYVEYQTWCWAQRALYPGRVSVADHYGAIGRVVTGVTSDEGIHLNVAGAWIVGIAWGVVSYDFFGGPVKEGPESIGTIIASLDANTYTSWTGTAATKSLNPANEIVSSADTAALAYLYSPLITTVATGVYAIWSDYTIDAAPPAQDYQAGPAFLVGGDAATKKAFGLSASGGSATTSFTGSVIGLGAPFAGTDNTANRLRFYIGHAPGNIVRIRRVCLIKL